MNKETLKSEVNRVVKMLIVTLSIMIFVLAVVSFMVSTQSSQKGYTFQQQKLKNEDLKNENDKLTQLITDITAFSQLRENEKLEQMTTLEELPNKTYITREDTVVK